MGSRELRKARSASPVLRPATRSDFGGSAQAQGEVHRSWRSPGFLVNVLHATGIMATAPLAGYSRRRGGVVPRRPSAIAPRGCYTYLHSLLNLGDLDDALPAKTP
jgi:hypothetical protein